MFASKTVQVAASLALLFSSVNGKSAPWSCMQLETSTDPYYRMFPAFLGSAKIEDESSLVLEDIKGHCFMKLKIFTDFKTNEDETELKAAVTFSLEE